MMQIDKPSDYVLATRKTYTVKDLISAVWVVNLSTCTVSHSSWLLVAWIGRLFAHRKCALPPPTQKHGIGRSARAQVCMDRKPTWPIRSLFLFCFQMHFCGVYINSRILTKPDQLCWHLPDGAIPVSTHDIDHGWVIIA